MRTTPTPTALAIRVLRRRLLGLGPGGWAGAAAGTVLAGVVLWRLGVGSTLSLGGPVARAWLGFLLASWATLAAYPALFGGSDILFLRRLGVPEEALYRRGAALLAGIVGAAGVVAAIPLAASGALSSGTAATVAALLAVTWGAGAWAYARAAARSVDAAIGEAAGSGAGPAGRRSSRLIPWDRELAAVGPLVYAPLLVLGAGVVGGVASGLFPGSRLVVAAGGGLLAIRGKGWYRAALPRFAGRAGELAFEPPPAHGTGELVVDDGIWRLLPRRVAALRARDAAILGRRRRWVARIVAPALAVAAAGLFRSRHDPGVLPWIVVLGAAVLAVQAGAGAGLAREGVGGAAAWLGRAVGAGPGASFAGRCLAVAGPTVVFGGLLALLWSLFAAPGPAWAWPGAAVAVSAAAAVPAWRGARRSRRRGRA